VIVITWRMVILKACPVGAVMCHIISHGLHGTDRLSWALARARTSTFAGTSRLGLRGGHVPDSVASNGIDDFTGHYAKIIDGLPAQPILIGHSFMRA